MPAVYLVKVDHECCQLLELRDTTCADHCAETHPTQFRAFTLIAIKPYVADARMIALVFGASLHKKSCDDPQHWVIQLLVLPEGGVNESGRVTGNGALHIIVPSAQPPPHAYLPMGRAISTLLAHQITEQGRGWERITTYGSLPAAGTP